MGRHVMEALGKARVVIEDGKVVSVGEPVVKYCPLFYKYRGIKELNCDTIRENMEFRMMAFGMCCPNRDVRMDNFLSFGISEVMCLALSKGILDAVVTAADGCGTAVITDPGIVQGMGGRISGIVETSPIEKVIDAIGPENVVDPKTTPIDQRKGVEMAVSKGYKKIAVTVAFPDDAEYLRKKYGDSVVIMAVHTTGISEADAERYFDYADVITACASRYVREVGSKRALIQAGTKVPIYGATEFGKQIIQLKLDELGRTADNTLDESPSPLL
ncbi:MAG: DUF2099 family protein [Candidatus Methanomethylophilaceae archaeon]|nr:DUF2099 family protein [Candidatus Methanomethylophilaceae archaeon]